MTDTKEFSDLEITRRMEAGIRRALSTPHKPTKELIGKTKRAKAVRRSRVVKSVSKLGKP